MKEPKLATEGDCCDSGGRASMGVKWESAHIEYRGGMGAVGGDDTIMTVIAPFIKECLKSRAIDRYFFVRYQEDEVPHIRLRMLGQRTGFRREVRCLLEKFVMRQVVETQLKVDWEPEWRVKWVSYEPEVRRYGGESLLRASEEFFCSSSASVTSILVKLRPIQQTQRLANGLLMALVLLHAIEADAAGIAAFCRRYWRGYLRQLVQRPEERDRIYLAFEEGYDKQSRKLRLYVRELWQRLQKKRNIELGLDAFWSGANRFSRRLREQRGVGQWGDSTSEGIVASHLHMTSNRLGLSVLEEIYVMFLMAESLSVLEPKVGRRSSSTVPGGGSAC